MDPCTIMGKTMTVTRYNRIHARILSHLDDRYTLDFTQTPADDESWSCEITFQLLDIQGDVRFLTMDGDIVYEEDNVEPHVEMGSMVHDILSLRWPIPWPKMDMVAAARLAWAAHVKR